jgi:general stress protein 26
MKNETDTATNPDIKKIGELISGIKVAMLVTGEADGALRGRPMMSQEVEFDGTLWFFSSDRSPKSAEIRRQQNVQLSYMDASKNRYISISGLAEIVHDKAKAAELWEPAYKAWFPGGLEDPNLSLIRVTVAQAEYWDGPSFAKATLLTIAKAFKGEAYAGQGGEHKKVALS